MGAKNAGRPMLTRHSPPNAPTVYRSALLLELGVPHAFTTRRGPGAAPFDVGPLDAVLRAWLCAGAGARATTGVVDAHQIHGATVAEVTEATGAAHDRPEADSLVTSQPALVLMRTADCVPILLASADGERVAAVHAGWRGLVAGVLPRTLEVMDGNEVVAAVGPCLSLERFEVGEEVAQAFVAAELASAIHTRPNERPRIDLRAAATIQLERARVRRIDVSDQCTWNDEGDFYSHRRDVTHGTQERAGRLAAVIGPRSASNQQAGARPGK